ncbi:hypothetical protein BDN67DRAFT_1024382 [Paxillus ammoniavirescens]|nr:hypothetical protein BDN67DRAFT_1024382 [Paxillus ammoniavirescens]
MGVDLPDELYLGCPSGKSIRATCAERSETRKSTTSVAAQAGNGSGDVHHARTFAAAGVTEDTQTLAGNDCGNEGSFAPNQRKRDGNASYAIRDHEWGAEGHGHSVLPLSPAILSAIERTLTKYRSTPLSLGSIPCGLPHEINSQLTTMAREGPIQLPFNSPLRPSFCSKDLGMDAALTLAFNKDIKSFYDDKPQYTVRLLGSAKKVHTPRVRRSKANSGRRPVVVGAPTSLSI